MHTRNLRLAASVPTIWALCHRPHAFIHTPLLHRNENRTYICECAEGWNGGGSNKTCEKRFCKRTGNQGLAKADDIKLGGTVIVKGYDYGDDYDNYSAKFDEYHHDGGVSKRWALEPGKQTI